MKVKQLITYLLKYNPNAEIRYLTSGCVGNQIRIQHTDSCVYICDAEPEGQQGNLSNPKESPVLAR